MHKHALSLLCEPFECSVSVTMFLVDFQSVDKTDGQFLNQEINARNYDETVILAFLID